MAVSLNNQNLFSDYYLQERVPTLPVWKAVDAQAEAAQIALREIFKGAEHLITGHEGQTEEHWIRPVLDQLGFHYQVFPAVATAEGTRWPDYALFGSEGARASSQASAGTKAYFEQALAVADAKVWDRKLDESLLGGDPFDRRNPNVQIDYYLRETDTRWAVLTNGRKWRLYSRDTSYRLDTFYEVDLIELMDREVEAFKYFWVFFNSNAFEGQPGSLLDQISSESVAFAEGLTSHVRDRVYSAVREFVNGFFAYSDELDPVRDIEAAFHGSLILLYRLLFILYAESRGLLPLDNPTYRSTYSLTAIKEELADRLDATMALQPSTNKYSTDLRNLFQLVNRGSNPLGVPEYNGGLFDDERHPFLKHHEVGDVHLARGIDLLTRVPGPDGHSVFVDYRSLDVRHLGDIYEGLLEYHARYAETEMVAVSEAGAEAWKPASEVPGDATIRDWVPAGEIYLSTGKGERRATGTYYTPQEIVAYMVEESVGRKLEELHQSAEGEMLVDEILSLRVCDPAMGSGHFLVEVVDFLARALAMTGVAEVTAEESESELQRWRRRVVERCVYGVDQNPLAVELAKLSLWLATVSAGRPLSFLDNHLVQGNSLLGAAVSQLGSLRQASEAQTELVSEQLERVLPQALEELGQIVAATSDSIEDVRAKEELLTRAREVMKPIRLAANAWISARFGADVDEGLYGELLGELHRPRRLAALLKDPRMRQVSRLNEVEYRFFHWEVEFPEVFLAPDGPVGFDIVLTNPPYVNAMELNDVLLGPEKPYWRTQFQSARGAYDLYVLFIELCLRLCREGGYATLITPNKYLAAPYAKALRPYVLRHHRILQILDASAVRVFDDPRVYPIVTLFQSKQPQSEQPVEVRRLQTGGEWEHLATHPAQYLDLLPELIWAFLLLDDADLLIAIAERTSPTTESGLLEIVASTTARESDLFGPRIREYHLSQDPGWKLLNTGIIERYAPAWGLERFYKQNRRFLRPVLPHGTPEVSETREHQYDKPKLVFSKLCTRLTASVDFEGECAGLDVNFIIAGKEAVDFYGALYNSRLMNWVYEGYFGALRMGGGYMQVQAPQLRVLPLPHEVNARGTQASPDEVAEVLRLGRERRELETQRVEERIQLIDQVLAILELGGRRDHDPSWVLPRQGALLALIEDPDADDLGGFWTVLRQTARQLGVRINHAKEGRIVTAAQEARAKLLALAEQASAADQQIDALVYVLYGLSDEDIARVESGPPRVAGLADEEPAQETDEEQEAAA